MLKRILQMFKKNSIEYQCPECGNIATCTGRLVSIVTGEGIYWFRCNNGHEFGVENY